MARVKNGPVEDLPETRPALTPEGRMLQCQAYAFDLAEKQLREGTASAMVICHFLKAASEKDKLEREKIMYEQELLKAKVKSIEREEKSDQFFKEVVDAMKVYRGESENDEDYEDIY